MPFLDVGFPKSGFTRSKSKYANHEFGAAGTHSDFLGAAGRQKNFFFFSTLQQKTFEVPAVSDRF